MKKRGFIGRLAALAMVLCLVTMSLTAGTLAKYASEASGTATATVAKWDVKFTDGTNPYTDTTNITLDLRDTAQETANLVAEKKVAPGTKGSFALAVDGGNTEVAFQYIIELDVSSLTDSPLAFYDGDPDNGGTKIEPASGAIKLEDSVLTNAASKKSDKTIWWKWETTTDAADTTLGTTAATSDLTYSIPVTITAEQLLTTT